MSNDWQVEILMKGTEEWNQWRKNNPGVGPYLNGADLSNTDFSGVDFSGNDKLRINLCEVNFSNSTLNGANFKKAYLNGANFTGAKLIDANFTEAQVLSTNFTRAVLTGSCIKDWHVSVGTRFDEVICEYFYMREDQCERRPHDPTQFFNAGDFTKLVQRALNTADLFFLNGINWEAFAYSFQKLQVEAGTTNISISSIESRSDSDFVVRVSVPLEFDKAEIQRFIEKHYQIALKAFEEKLQLKEEQLEQYRRENTNLWSMVQVLANKSTTIEINTQATVNSDNQSKNVIYNQQGAKFGGGFAAEGGMSVGGHLLDGSIQQNFNRSLEED